MFLGLFDKSLCVGQCFVVVEVHVVCFAERAVHHSERVESECCKAFCFRVGEADWATCAKSEASNIGIAHCEIVGDMGIDKRFHIVGL